MKVELVSITKPEVEGVETAEELIAYCARVSNPSNQMNTESAPKLLRYLINNKHWSPFEMVNMCVSIETSRAIAAQILRHRSFSFQEFSQRYASVADLEDMLEPIELRKAGVTNRQSSAEKVEDDLVNDLVRETLETCNNTYHALLESGVSTETARFVLPLTTKTRIYMNGTLRSWIHYLDSRCDKHTQKEHRLVADQIRHILVEKFPTVYDAIYNI